MVIVYKSQFWNNKDKLGITQLLSFSCSDSVWRWSPRGDQYLFFPISLFPPLLPSIFQFITPTLESLCQIIENCFICILNGGKKESQGWFSLGIESDSTSMEKIEWR